MVQLSRPLPVHTLAGVPVYRGGPVLGSAISGIDQALWDIRGKVMNLPVYEMLGGPVDARGVRGYYHAAAWSLSEARELRDQTRQAGVTALKFQLPDLLERLLFALLHHSGHIGPGGAFNDGRLVRPTVRAAAAAEELGGHGLDGAYFRRIRNGQGYAGRLDP